MLRVDTKNSLDLVVHDNGDIKLEEHCPKHRHPHTYYITNPRAMISALEECIKCADHEADGGDQVRVEIQQHNVPDYYYIRLYEGESPTDGGIERIISDQEWEEIRRMNLAKNKMHCTLQDWHNAPQK